MNWSLGGRGSTEKSTFSAPLPTPQPSETTFSTSRGRGAARESTFFALGGRGLTGKSTFSVSGGRCFCLASTFWPPPTTPLPSASAFSALGGRGLVRKSSFSASGGRYLILFKSPFHQTIMPQKPQPIPMMVPRSTSPNLWSTRIMRLLITAPEMRMATHNHHVGLK